jgi:hypothetical protein
MKHKSFILIVFFLLLVGFTSAAEEKPKANLHPVFFQAPGEVGFSRIDIKNTLSLPDGAYMAKPVLKSPLASDTVLNISSHTITLFPGAVLKKRRNKLKVLAGRIMIETDNKNVEPIVFAAKRYLCQFNYGKLLIETTPMNDSWILMKNNGSAWIKTSNRKIIELQAGNEIEIPLFGAVNVGERPGSRWNFAPETAVVKDVKAIFAPTPEPAKAKASSSKKLEIREVEVATNTAIATYSNSEIE